MQTRAMQVLQAMSDWWKYWWWELNNKTWYFKACTRASELHKKWRIMIVKKKRFSKNWQQAYQYIITDEWLLQCWINKDKKKRFYFF